LKEIEFNGDSKYEEPEILYEYIKIESSD